MNTTIYQPEKVLCDLHAHPSAAGSLEEKINLLGSVGLVGLAAWHNSKSILTYEQAAETVHKDPSFREITAGQLAQFREGYFARTQEIPVGQFHLLAVGWKGNYFRQSDINNYDIIEDAVNDIHRRGGIVILNHPFVAMGGLLYRSANTREEKIIKKTAEVVDEIEVHNASCINLVPYLMDFRKANTKAVSLAENYRFQGTAASDCHGDYAQAKVCGVYIDEKTIVEKGMEGIKESICKGDFQRYGDADQGPYLSRGNWLKGMTWNVWVTVLEAMGRR